MTSLECLSWNGRLVLLAIWVGIILYIMWLRRRARKVHDLEYQIRKPNEEQAGLRRQIADLESRLALRTKEYVTTAEALERSAADIERLTEALRILQTRNLDPPKLPRGTGPVRRQS
jgi:septal ring factor EnvC (AmiA/AmiB activator)